MAGPLRMRGIDIEVSAGTGIGNVRTLEHGETDIAVAAADAVYYSFVGELDPGTRPFDGLRGIAVLQITAAVLIVGAHSGINQFSDINGHTVSIGSPDGSLARMARMSLRAFGIEPKALRSLTTAEATRELIDGTLDAMFVGSPLDGAGLEDLIRAGARLLPITGPPIDQLLREFPFWQAAVVRPRFPGDPIITLGGVNVFVCSRDLDDELVYNFTKSFFDLLPTLSSDLGLRLMDAELAPATPIPLHEGAARYYREREMSR